MKLRVKVGKRLAVYIPARVARELEIREGDTLLLIAGRDEIVLRKVEDPLELALRGSKFAEVDPMEVEEVSLAEQRRKAESSA